jgi:hypothetical protein
MSYASGKMVVNLPPFTGIYTFFEEAGSFLYPIPYRRTSAVVPRVFGFDHRLQA